MIITITILLFSHIHVRHIEPNWTCSWARFTLVAYRTVNAFAVHWSGRVKITTVPNQTEPGPVKITPYIQSLRESSRVFTKITQNVMKIRCKYYKLHQINNRPLTSPCYRYANFHFQNLRGIKQLALLFKQQGLNTDSPRDNWKFD